MSKPTSQRITHRLLPALSTIALVAAGCGEDIEAGQDSGWRLSDPFAPTETFETSPDHDKSREGIDDQHQQIGDDVARDQAPPADGSYPAPPSRCPMGLPWRVTTQDATVRYVDGIESGAIEVSLDGAEGGIATFQLPPVGGDMDITLSFSGLEQAPWGTYEVGVILHDPTSRPGPSGDNTPSFYLDGRINTITTDDTSMGMGGQANGRIQYGVRAGRTPAAGYFRLRRDTSRKYQSIEMDLTHDDTTRIENYEVDVTSDLQLLVYVRGNMPSQGAMLRLEGIHASNSGGELYDDDFDCDSSTHVPFEDVAAIYRNGMIEGDGPRPEL